MLRHVSLVLSMTILLAQLTPQQRPGISNGAAGAPPVSRPANPSTAADRAVEVEIAVEDSRPLAEATRQLQYKLGVPISYEDIPWVDRSDLMPLGQFPNPANQRVANPDKLAPTLGRLAIKFPIREVSRTPLSPVDVILQLAVGAHQQRNNPGEFKVQSLLEGQAFSVVPSRAKDANGNWRAVQSPLDVLISLPDENRSGEATVAAIVKAVSEASGSPITVYNDVPMEPIHLGATNEVARNVLVRALHEAYDWKASWRLYYDPSDGVWGLNFGAVYQETGKLTAGRPEIDAVRWPGRPWVRPR